MKGIKAMTAAEQLKQQGMKIGIEKGALIGKTTTAKNML